MSTLTTALDALDSATPINSKQLVNYFQQNTNMDTSATESVQHTNGPVNENGVSLQGSTFKETSKKRGTLNSNLNLYTFIKLLEETTRDCERECIEIVPENLTKFVQRYRLSINKLKEAETLTKQRESTPCVASDDDVEEIAASVILDKCVEDATTMVTNTDSATTSTADDDGGDNENKRKLEDREDDNNDGALSAENNVCKKQKRDLSNLYLKVYNCLFVALERENMTVSFSREHLRYFLATYQKFITLDDFKYTNKQNNNDSAIKKNKSKNILHNGAILLEYVKSPTAFQNNLSRCNNNDADALRYITNNGINLPENIYKPLLLTINDQIVVNKSNDVYEDYVKLMFNGTKHHVICVTENILLIWDGVQFTIPTVYVERDITATLLYGTCKSNELYVLQTFVCSNKLKIADVLYVDSPTNEFTSNLTYVERHRLFNKIFKNWDVAKIETESYNNSNIQVPNIADCTKTMNRYVFIKPGQIVAAVGIDKQNVLIAFKRSNDDNDLEFKIKVPNCGAASVVLLTQPMRFMNKSVDEHHVRIRDLNNDFVNVHEIPFNSDIRIFKKYVPVELRDSNKLGSYMIGPIDDVTEFKQQNVQKNQMMVRMFDRIINDPRHLQEFMTYFVKNVNDSTKERFCSGIKIPDRINDCELNFKF